MKCALFGRLLEIGDGPALVADGTEYSGTDLIASMEEWRTLLRGRGLGAGAVVGLRGEYGRRSVALLLCLLREGQVAVALPGGEQDVNDLLESARVDLLVDLRDASRPALSVRQPGRRPALLQSLCAAGRAGLVVFSSGTTGASKAALFDFEVLSRRYLNPGRARRTLAFLFLDHLGGINTLLHTLAAGGVVIAAPGRSPEVVARCIEENRVEVLPATPTFLRMLLMAGALHRFDLSSLRLITYGTEPMPDVVLAQLRQAFPEVRLKQTYGLSELGVLPTRSPSSDSAWIELGGLGCETRIVDGRLQIRSETAMQGYLNAPSPFDDEGWYDTQDLVVCRGSMFRILGRASDVINVGGEKVHPVEVEDTLLTLPNVEDAQVRGQDNPLTGQVVVARVSLGRPEDQRALLKRVHRHCREHLAPHKVPAIVEISETPLIGGRLKKSRAAGAQGETRTAFEALARRRGTG